MQQDQTLSLLSADTVSSNARRNDEEAGEEEEHPTEPLSIIRMLALNMHAFNYGLFYASVGVLLLPEEALHMFEQNHAVFLAVMLVLAGVSQLVSPAAGYWSDRCTAAMGRRMPFVLLGNLVLFICLGLMYLARTYLYGYLYLFLLYDARFSACTKSPSAAPVLCGSLGSEKPVTHAP
eukprot:3936216-Rhodomonas_salina.2